MTKKDAASIIKAEIERRSKNLKPYEPGQARWANGFVDGLKWALKLIREEKSNA